MTHVPAIDPIVPLKIRHRACNQIKNRIGDLVLVALLTGPYLIKYKR